MVVANNGSSVVSVFFGDGAGNVGAPTSVNFGGAVVSSGPAPGAVALPDVNGDGTLDLVVALGSYGVAISLGNSSGGFSATATWGGYRDNVSVADVQEATGFELFTEGVVESRLPTDTELTLIREVLDPKTLRDKEVAPV